jgi:hypothetical protein
MKMETDLTAFGKAGLDDDFREGVAGLIDQAEPDDVVAVRHCGSDFGGRAPQMLQPLLLADAVDEQESDFFDVRSLCCLRCHVFPHDRRDSAAVRCA